MSHYTFQRVSTGGVRVLNPLGIKVLFIPRYMLRDLVAFVEAEGSTDRPVGAEEESNG